MKPHFQVTMCWVWWCFGFLNEEESVTGHIKAVL